MRCPLLYPLTALALAVLLGCPSRSGNVVPTREFVSRLSPEDVKEILAKGTRFSLGSGDTARTMHVTNPRLIAAVLDAIRAMPANPKLPVIAKGHAVFDRITIVPATPPNRDQIFLFGVGEDPDGFIYGPKMKKAISMLLEERARQNMTR